MDPLTTTGVVLALIALVGGSILKGEARLIQALHGRSALQSEAH